VAAAKLVEKLLSKFIFVFEPNREVMLWSSRRAAAGRGRWGHGEAQWQKMTSRPSYYSRTREYEYMSRISAIRVKRRRGSARRGFRYWYYPDSLLHFMKGDSTFFDPGTLKSISTYTPLATLIARADKSNKRSPDRPYVAPTYVAPTSKIPSSASNHSRTKPIWNCG